MKKNILKISIVAIIFILLIQLNSFATSVTIETKTNGNIYNIGGTVTSTIDWTQGMQATGFTLEYNSTKLSFTEASIKDDFYNISEPTLDSSTGEYFTNIIVSWASFEEVDFTSITFTFKTIATGEANIAITNVDCFADENLESPEEIDYTTGGTQKIKIFALGDMDLDSNVDMNDIELLQKYLNGLTELNENALVNADINLDGNINEFDVKLLRLYLNKSINILPVIYGDIYIDGTVNSKDKFTLNRFLDDEWEIELDQDALIRADVNLDGLVNDFDSLILGKVLLNWNGYKLPMQVIINSNLNVFSLEDKVAISGFKQESMNVSDLIKNFNTDIGCSVYNIKGEKLTSNDDIGTGTIVRIGEDNQEENSYIAEYNVVIYGDTTGDGKINAIDALALIKDMNGKITFSSKVYREAGRILSNGSENPTAVDALAIIKHSNGKYKISQSK